MNPAEPSIDHLLHPVSLPAFVGDYWEKAPLHLSRHHPGYYDGLFDLDDVERYLFAVKPAGNALRLIGRGRADITFEPHVAAPLPAVYQALRDGYTLNIHGVQRHWPPVHRLADAVSRALKCYVNVNAYVTGPASQGFDTHYDGHDVLVLQTCGSKRWRLYAVQEELPLEGSETPRRTPPAADATHDAASPDDGWGEPVREMRMSAGDLLFLPRGIPHSAVALEQYSVHLTLGLRPVLLQDVLLELVQRVVRRDVRWRRSLPIVEPDVSSSPEPAGSSTLPPVERLSALLNEGLAALGPLEPLIEPIRRRLMDGEAPVGAGPGGYLSSLDQLETLGLETVLECRPGHSSRVAIEGEQVVVTFSEGRVEVPAFCEPAIRLMLERPRFRVDSLTDVLTDGAKLKLCRHLVREGLLRMVTFREERGAA